MADHGVQGKKKFDGGKVWASGQAVKSAFTLKKGSGKTLGMWVLYHGYVYKIVGLDYQSALGMRAQLQEVGGNPNFLRDVGGTKLDEYAKIK